MKIKLLAAAAAFAALTLCAPYGEAKPFKKPRMPGQTGGPGTTTPKFVEDYYQEQQKESDALKRLNADAKTLDGDQLALMGRVRNVQDFLDTTASRLGMLSTLDADLKKLETAINTVYTAAETAEAIPQAREKAKKVKETLAPAKANVTAARQRLDKIVAKTEPLRRKLETAAERAGQLNEGLWLLDQGVITQIPNATAIANRCLLRSPEAIQPCVSRTLDSKADEVDRIVREYDKAVLLLLSNPGDWLPSVEFFNPFGAELTAIDAMRADLERLVGRLEALTSQLGTLNAVLDRSFSFKFPYPDPAWDNPIRTSDYKVSVSFRTIIKGVDAIESEIESILSSFLWDVLKGLGVGKYVKMLQDAADDAVNYALNLVHFDVNLDLPSMASLDPFENALAELEADINGIKIPTVGENLPNFGMPSVPAGVNLGGINGSFRFFSPNGWEWNAPGICDGVTYGCK